MPLLNNSKELELLYIRDFGSKENFKNLDFENATTNLLKIYSKFNHESDNLKNIFEKKKDIFNIVDAHVKEKNANLTERIISNTDLKYLVKVILFDSFVGRQDVQMFHTGGKRFHNIKLFQNMDPKNTKLYPIPFDYDSFMKVGEQTLAELQRKLFIKNMEDLIRYSHVNSDIIANEIQLFKDHQKIFRGIINKSFLSKGEIKYFQEALNSFIAVLNE